MKKTFFTLLAVVLIGSMAISGFVSCASYRIAPSYEGQKQADVTKKVREYVAKMQGWIPECHYAISSDTENEIVMTWNDQKTTHEVLAVNKSLFPVKDTTTGQTKLVEKKQEFRIDHIEKYTATRTIAFENGVVTSDVTEKKVYHTEESKPYHTEYK